MPDIVDWYHVSVNVMGDTNLPAHVDERETGGPGEIVLNYILTNGAPDDGSAVIFQRGGLTSRKLAVRALRLETRILYWFSGPTSPL